MYGKVPGYFRFVSRVSDRSRESTSGLAVEDVWPGARAGVVFRQLPRAEVVLGGSPGGCRIPVSVSGFCYIAQNSSLHDVHSMKTAMPNASGRFLLYHF